MKKKAIETIESTYEKPKTYCKECKKETFSTLTDGTFLCDECFFKSPNTNSIDLDETKNLESVETLKDKNNVNRTNKRNT
jgi:ribosomal protein L37AE/L43A